MSRTTDRYLEQAIEDRKLEYIMDAGNYCEDCHQWADVCQDMGCEDCVECGGAKE